MRARPWGVRVADLTIQGVNNEKSAKVTTVAPRDFIGHDEGSEFRKGNVFMKRAIAKRLRPAMTNASRAQNRAGSLPASLLAWVTLQAETEKAKKANERLTQWPRFLEYTRAPRPALRILTKTRRPRLGTGLCFSSAERQDGVRSAKRMCSGQCVSNPTYSCDIWNVVEITSGIRDFIVDGRRYDPV